MFSEESVTSMFRVEVVYLEADFSEMFGNFLPDYMASRPRRQSSSHSQQREAKIL